MARRVERGGFGLTVRSGRSVFRRWLQMYLLRRSPGRYGLNANLIFKWLRDQRFAPDAAQAPCFLPVEIVSRATHEAERLPATNGQIEVELAGGHRLQIRGAYDPEALARLIRGFSG